MELLLMNIFIFLFFLFYRTKIKARRALVKFMRCFSFALEDKHGFHNMILHCVAIFFIQEEYTQKTGLASAPPSHTDEQKKEVLAYELIETSQHAKISCKHYQLIQALSLFLNYNSNSFIGFATALYLRLY